MAAGARRSAKRAGHTECEGAEVTKKHTKKAPKIKGPSENEIHLKCWQWVRKAHPRLLIFHVANERQASVQYHVKMKRLGVLKGVADFLTFLDDGRKIAIELKNAKGVQDTDQIKFQKRWERTGGEYYVVRTVEDFQNIVTALMLFR